MLIAVFQEEDADHGPSEEQQDHHSISQRICQQPTAGDPAHTSRAGLHGHASNAAERLKSIKSAIIAGPKGKDREEEETHFV